MVATVGVIGLGNMGGPMAAVLTEEFDVVGHDLDADRRQALADQSGTPVDTPAAVGEAAEVVLLSLPSDEALRAVMTGADGLLPVLEPGDVVVDTSTVSPTVSREMRAACGDRDVAFLDAPVSGGSRNADTGDLSTMVGGPADVLERVRPVLEAISKEVRHVGPAGSGIAIKLVNNYMFAVNQLVMFEALTVAREAGIDDEVFVDVVSDSSGDSYAVERNMRRFVIPEEYEAEAAISIIHKDVELAEEFAGDLNVPLVAGGGVSNLYRLADQLGLADQDVAAMVQLWELEDVF